MRTQNSIACPNSECDVKPVCWIEWQLILLNVGDMLGLAFSFLPVLNFSTLLTHVRMCGPYSNYLVWLFLDSILYYHNSILKSQRMSMAASKGEKYLKRGWGWLGLSSIVYCLPNMSEAHEFCLQHSITEPKGMTEESPSLRQPVPNI